VWRASLRSERRVQPASHEHSIDSVCSPLVSVEIAWHVKQHFEFLVCEPSLSTELCDAKKGCVVCHKFAAK